MKRITDLSPSEQRKVRSDVRKILAKRKAAINAMMRKPMPANTAYVGEAYA